MGANGKPKNATAPDCFGDYHAGEEAAVRHCHGCAWLGDCSDGDVSRETRAECACCGWRGARAELVPAVHTPYGCPRCHSMQIWIARD